jgi:hypothetical protein
MIRGFLEEFWEILKEFFEKEEFWFIVFLAALGGFLFLPFIPLDVLLKIIIQTFLYLWWLWVFLILFFSLRELILFWRREIYKSQSKFILLEIKPPARIEENFEAMDQFLGVLSNFRKAPGNIKEKYVDGILNNVFSLEIVRKNEEIKFFIRIPQGLKRNVETAFFTYYPEAELEEAEDYIDDIPETDVEASLKDMDVWGGEMVLEKEEAYPIRTYRYFSNLKRGEKRFDPLIGFLEVMSKLKKEEFLAIQIIIEPMGYDWRKKFEGVLKSLKSESSSTSENVSSGVSKTPPSSEEVNLAKIVENNLSKPGFLTLVRFLYLAPAHMSDRALAAGILSPFSQYRGTNFNGLRPNKDVITSVDIWGKPLSFIYAKKKLKDKISRLLYNFRKREISFQNFWGKVIYFYPFAKISDVKRFYFSTESLATLFHIPATDISSTIYFKKMPTRKVSPPIGLAIFGEEEEVKKFE